MELLLHVGHGKTGSSFLQGALALSEMKDLSYPVSEVQAARASQGRLTSGNITYGPGCFEDFSEFSGNKLLLSSESLFKPLVDGFLLRDVRAALEPARIRILLFVRDPFENAVSSYFQAVQKGKEAGDFTAYLKKFSRPRQVASAIRNSSGAELRIINYSDHRKELLQKFSDWIGSNLEAPASRVANRSLTVDEAALLYRLNRLLPAGATNGLGSRLCADLPMIKGRRITVSQACIDEFTIRMKSQVDEVHDLLGYEIYRAENLECYVGDDITDYQFSSEQLSVIARSVAAKWKCD